jgi:hypothetical protein
MGLTAQEGSTSRESTLRPLGGTSALCSIAWRSRNTLANVIMVSRGGPSATTGLGQLREASMRLLTLLLLISAVLFPAIHVASAQSPISYPWCSRSSDANSNICYFKSKEQCQVTTSGVSSFCIANPTYQPPPPASDEAVNAPRRPGGEQYQLPGEQSRRVSALQSGAVRAKQSTSTGDHSPGDRPDAGAAEGQVPKQETWSFPLADVIAGGLARVVSAIDR